MALLEFNQAVVAAAVAAAIMSTREISTRQAAMAVTGIALLVEVHLEVLLVARMLAQVAQAEALEVRVPLVAVVMLAAVVLAVLVVQQVLLVGQALQVLLGLLGHIYRVTLMLRG